MELLKALTDQKEKLSKLKQLLESELHLISSREPETLMALLNQKEEVLTQIESLDSHIAPLYTKAKKENKISEQVSNIVSECNTLIDECKYLTQINAKSVEQGQLRLTHLRNLMMELRTRESMTYDKSGRVASDKSSGGFTA